MKILNESGIKKLIKYIGDDHCRCVNISGKSFIEGPLSDSDINAINNAGVLLNNVYGNLHEAVIEDDDVDSGIDSKDNIGALVKSLMPYLERYFVSKEEVNNALNDLKASMIDPNEMIDGLKMQIKRIEKQSRENDEIG